MSCMCLHSFYYVPVMDLKFKCGGLTEYLYWLKEYLWFWFFYMLLSMCLLGPQSS